MGGRIVFLSLVLVLLNACGGGGESGSSSPPNVTTGNTLVYTGSTELATLTKDNARQFAGAMMGSSEETANTLNVAASVNSSPDTQHQGILRASLELSKVIHSTGQQPSLNHAYRAAALTPVDRVENCNQGTIHYQGSLNDNGTGKITATYNHCNQDGQLQNGVMIYTINGVDTLGTNLTDAIIQLQQFSIKGTDGDALLEGTIHTQFDPNKNTGADTFNIVFIDNVLGLVGKVENLIVTTLYSNLANSTAHNDSITGRLFLAPYGYVDIATIGQLIYDTDSQPFPNVGGTIVLTGKQDTRLSLISKSSSIVTLELDSDGDKFNELATTLGWNLLTSKQPTENLSPIADAGNNQTVYKGSVVTVDGSASNDPNFDFMTYHWSFVQIPAGSQAKLNVTDATTMNFQPDVLGNYVLHLIVNDGLTESTPATVMIMVTGKFTKTELLDSSRLQGHTATLLPNGNVLIVGGYGPMPPTGGIVASIQRSSVIYDTATGNFVASGNLSVPRTWHTATLLNNGNVLIVGGTANSVSLAELYDPAAGTFTPAGNTVFPRTGHTATLLPNGKVLIVGSTSEDPTTASELYDPETGKFTPTADQASLRYFHAATLLANGKVLIVGGSNKRAEIYDPITDSFSPSGNLNYARSGHAAIPLPNGKVFIVGGSVPIGNATLSNTDELYDPSTEQFTVIKNYIEPFYSGYTATLLHDGKVLLTGGSYAHVNRHAELYDPINNSFVTAGTLNVGRHVHTATVLKNGHVLIVGGDYNAGVTPELYSY